jgi:hypothetical protein
MAPKFILRWTQKLRRYAVTREYHSTFAAIILSNIFSFDVLLYAMRKGLNIIFDKTNAIEGEGNLEKRMVHESSLYSRRTGKSCRQEVLGNEAWEFCNFFE